MNRNCGDEETIIRQQQMTREQMHERKAQVRNNFKVAMAASNSKILEISSMCNTMENKMTVR